MNRKGFTMVELLGTVVILGILMTFGMITFFGQRDRSAKKAYNLIHEGAAQGAENYFMDVPGDSTVTIDQLVDLEYMEPAIDPWDKEGKCIGEVEKILEDENKKHDDAIDLYYFKVQVKCAHGCTCLIYPKKTPCECVGTYRG